MSTEINIKLNHAIIPSIPFLWYREEELTCPIEYIKYDNNVFTIIQRHILENANIYICLHSLLYFTLHKNQINDNMLIIPESYINNTMFTVTINEEIENCVVTHGNSLKLNIPMNGPVFIHGGAFSPPGYPYFRVNLNNELNKILCNVNCQQLGIDINCVFILFNNVNEISISENIKMFIDRNNML